MEKTNGSITIEFKENKLFMKCVWF